MGTVSQCPQQAVYKQQPKNPNPMSVFLLDFTGLYQGESRTLSNVPDFLHWFEVPSCDPEGAGIIWTSLGILLTQSTLYIQSSSQHHYHRPHEAMMLVHAYSSYWLLEGGCPHCLPDKGNATSSLSKETSSLKLKAEPVRG